MPTAYADWLASGEFTRPFSEWVWGRERESTGSTKEEFLARSFGAELDVYEKGVLVKGDPQSPKAWSGDGAEGNRSFGIGVPWRGEEKR